MATVTGTSGNDNLAGTAPDLIGNVSGADLISGLGGNDNISGFGGQDTIYAGQGNDNVVYGQVQVLQNDPYGEFIRGDLGADVITSAGSRGFNTIYGGNGTSADSADGANSINVSNDTGADVIYAGGGGDTITLGVGNMIAATVVGGAGSDQITGSLFGQDHALILGNMGNDSITGDNGGGDSLYGGKGNDTILAQGGNNLVSSDLDNDFVATNSAVGTDSIYGGKGADTITNFTSAVGFANGNDLIFGGLDSDIISVGGGGNHSVYGGTDTIGSAADSANTISGAATTNRDVYVGGGGADSIVASTSNNGIGAGTTATSNSAVDTLTGGGGNDTFSFTALTAGGLITGAGNTLAKGGTDVDSVTDFLSGSDKFQLAGAGAVTQAGPATATAQQNANAQTTLSLAANAVLAQDNKAGVEAAEIFNFNNSNYLVVDTDKSGTFNAGDYLLNVNQLANVKTSDFI